MRKPAAPARLFVVRTQRPTTAHNQAEPKTTLWVQVPFDLEPMEEAEHPIPDFDDLPFDFSFEPDEEEETDHA